MTDEERKRERKVRKGQKRREKYVQGQLLSICIQFSKRKTKYIGRNARNFKKWLLLLRRPIYYNRPPAL